MRVRGKHPGAPRGGWGWRVCCGLLSLVFAAAAGAAGLDPKVTVGPEECALCHALEYSKWQQTAHAHLYASPEPLHQRPKALEIAGKLGLSLIKTDTVCLDCHYTPKASGDRVTARAGVSCESCHGPARSWLHVHNQFEGRRADRLAEAPATTRRRELANAAAGMVARGRLYDLYSGCLTCHAVPNETIVEDGGHPAGGSFDFAARFDTVRHLFVTGGRKANAPLSPERRRDLRLLGPLVELEHGLRNLAAARRDGSFRAAQTERVERARKALKRLEKRAPLGIVTQALGATEGFSGADPARLVSFAEAVVRLGREYFAPGRDRAELVAFDREPVEEPPLAVVADAGVSPPAEASAAADSVAPATPTGAAPAVTTRPARAGIAGERRAVLRASPSGYPVIDPGRCGSCHGEAQRWWSRDPHKRTADRLLDGAPAAVRIATAYYDRAVDLTIGRWVCANCHATVVTGEEAEEVAGGVSCQSCHGGAGKFFEPHKRAGLPRAERLALGLVDLQDPAVRARDCASCHYVTDRRLLASGHPTGRGFKMAERLAKIVHWQRPQPPAATLAAAWDAEISRRGPPPVVQVAVAAGPTAAPPTGSSSAPPAWSPPVAFPGPSSARAAAPARGAGVPLAPPPRSVQVLAAAPPWPANVETLPLPELLAELWRHVRRLTDEGGPP